MLLGRGALQPVLHTYKVPNRYMNLELLTTDQLRDRVEKLSIEHIKLCQDNFLYFVQSVWPDFICRKEKDPKKWGHHQHIAYELTKISKGKGGRLIVNMPPRHTKSEFACKAKGRWETNHGGEYYAAGVGGSITGRGADLLIIDDPHTEQDAMSDSAMERAYEWYSSGPRQRLQPGGNILLVMTRWAQDDLTGRLLKSQSDIKADKWNIIEFPAILPTGASVWPEYWSLEELEKVKASISVRNWNAQYMQDPVAEEGAILKREWWQSWKGQVPSLKHVIQSYDTAFSKKESADYSAITTWGVFEPTPGDNCLILLDAEKGRWDFPELKAVALEAYKYWEPESVIVEAKASGQSLIQEMRRAGIPVMDFIPSRGKDKHSRVNACAPVFESGNVYYPDDAHFAEEVIEECAAFPFGQHDDYVDSTTQAVLRYRQGNFVGTYMDEPEPMKIEQDYKYYG
jgi:predicted phage terminase large subunit-like protein